MTVKEFIEKLKKEDPKAVVIISEDAEGNGYSEIAEICRGFHDEEFQPRQKKLTPELITEGYSQEDIYEDGIPAIFLFRV